MQDVGETPPATGDRRELESEIETLQTDICDYLNHLPEQLLASDRAIQTMTEEFISLGVIAQTDVSGTHGRSRARSTIARTRSTGRTRRSCSHPPSATGPCPQLQNNQGRDSSVQQGIRGSHDSDKDINKKQTAVFTEERCLSRSPCHLDDNVKMERQHRHRSLPRKTSRTTCEKIESKILRAARVESPHEGSPTPAYPYHSRSTPFLFAGDTIFLQSKALASHAYDLAMCVAPLTDYHLDASISVRMLDRSRPATSTHITFFLARNTPVQTVLLYDAMENMVDGRLLKIQWERKDVRKEEDGKTYFLERALDKAYTSLAKINWPDE
ncbi:hypothetical protein BDZ88DRAFT_455650 [Geranomyces variabilis]|nr:hypothetical protein BDZ88DRAFT_455650 [Geranomyces variabilis]KAJ3131861.1 hypothetical protein HDU90_007690 [Geranomyces variabilis]